MNKSLLCLTVATGVCCNAFTASGDTDKAAQLYDVKVVIKTTSAKKASISASKNPFISETAPVVYRVQSSQTWKGVIWGCNCDAIRGNWTVIDQTQGIVAGCVIWDTKSPYTIIFDEDIHWRLLNAIDKTGTKCEGTWTIGDSSDSSNAFLSFAGFGTLVLSTQKEDGDLSIADCMSHVKTISGNVSGWMPAPYVTNPGKSTVCTFCGVISAGEDESHDYATAWNFCDCAEFGDSDFTAVSGTWSIKYNSSLSKKLFNSTSILEVYKAFPPSVKASVEKKISEVLGNN